MEVLSFAVNGVVADFARETLRDADAQLIPLRPRAFAVLRYLVGHPGRVVTKDELTAAVWPDLAVTDDSLVQCIHQIRDAIGDDARTIVRTVPRRGYLLDVPPHGPHAATQPRRLLSGLAAVAAILLLTAAVFLIRDSNPPAEAEIWVAVLPFAATGADDRKKGFADALAEDVAAELSRVKALRVLARNSVAPFAGPPPDMEGIAGELGADYAVEAGLEFLSDTVRVNARLIDAADRTLVWADRFDRPTEDLFAIRDELVTEVVGTLSSYGGVIWREWLERAERTHPQNLTALELLIRAKPLYERQDESGIREARALIEQALALDPAFQLGWTFLAGTHVAEIFAEWGNPEAAWRNFEAATERSVALDPNYGRAQVHVGLIAFHRLDKAAGLAAFERALAHYPNDVLVLSSAGVILPLALGVEEAARGVALAERALALDPGHPPFQWFNLAYPLYFAGRYDEAAAALRKLPKLWFESRLLLVLALAQAGQVDAARTEADELMRLDPGFAAESWLANDFYQPESSSVDRFVEGARKAGLPVCASDPTGIDPRERLLLCDGSRETARSGAMPSAH